MIVPGWGALIARRIAARYDAEAGLFIPPHRELSFNPAITATDGLLAASVSRRERIPYAKAAEAVYSEVDSLRHQLEFDGELTLPRIGTFRRPAPGATPLFEPATDTMVNASFSALPSIEVSAASADEEGADAAAVVAHEIKPRRRVPMFVRIAASMAILLGVGFAATDNSLLNDRADHTDYASMSPTNAPRPSELITDDVEAASELFIAMPADPQASVTITPPPSQPTKAATSPGDAAPRYCLVVASLPSRALAQKFIAGQGDPSLRILESQGRFRVYAAGAATKEEAAAKHKAVASRYPDAWVCSR